MKRTRELQYRFHPEWQTRDTISSLRDFDGEDLCNLYIYQNMIQESTSRNNNKKISFCKNRMKIRLQKILKKMKKFNMQFKHRNLIECNRSKNQARHA